MTTPIHHSTNLSNNESTFSTNINIDTITVSTQLNSVVSNTLANTDLLSPLLVASLAPSANQFIGTDNLNQLGWQNLPLAIATPVAMFDAAWPQDFNAAASLYIQFVNPARYNNTPIVYDGVDTFTLPVDTVFEIDLRVMSVASASEVIFTIEFDGVPYRELLLSPTDSNGCSKEIITSVVGANTVKIMCTRSGVDATPKINFTSTSTQIIFKRIA